MKIQTLDCPKCGASIAPESKFCPYCGSGLVLSDDRVRSDRPGVLCPHCGANNRATDTYCGKCGELLLRSCPHCHEDVPVNSTHCPACGVEIESGRKESREQDGVLQDEYTARRTIRCGVSRSSRGKGGWFRRSFRGGRCGCGSGRGGGRRGRRGR